MLKRLDLRPRAYAAGIHLLISVAVAGLAAVLVFAVWYPGAFRFMAGGRDLFLLVTAVDVVIGPVLTFAVFNRAKGKRHLGRDLAVIGLLQIAALVYGLHTVYVARPVAMVFEVERFRMVTANDVHVDELPKALPEFRELSLTGPRVIGARRPEVGAERNDAMFMGVNGVDVGQRPIFWQPYEKTQARALERSRPIPLLLLQYPQHAEDTRQRLADMKADEASARFLPVMARSPWVAVLDKTGALLGYLPLDGFF
ncbi:MAG: pilus assembly protein [Burkholderiales bacterium]|nr:pilus assembly protein [Burkholderiales bacterium]